MYTYTHLIHSIVHDLWPSPAVLVDFGIDTNHSLYGVYQRGIRESKITEQDLKNALGDGPKLTAMLKEKMGLDIKVTTMYDLMHECEEEDEAN
jgi:hypothetical protein